MICFRPRNRPSLNYKGFPTRRFQGCSRNNADTFRTNQVDILPVQIGSGIGPILTINFAVRSALPRSAFAVSDLSQVFHRF